MIASDDDRSLLAFPAQAYKYKEISDYGFGNRAVITEAEARGAIVGAERFIGSVTARLRS